MKAFWRTEPLEPKETTLLQALLKTHYQSCFRDNASSVSVMNAADSSQELSKAIVAGLATMGARHAPVEDTAHMLGLGLAELSREVDQTLAAGEKVPGWGGNFQGVEPDALWAEVDKILHCDWPELGDKLDSVTARLAARAKLLQPNPSAYTACAALALRMPPKLAPYLFILGRISGWAEIAANYLGE
jgi:citrate synthase